MKAGDKVYCKKSLHDADTDTASPREYNFIVGNYYAVLESPPYDIDNKKSGGVFLDSNDRDDSDERDNGYWFHYGTKHDSIVNRFSDYFYTEKELRKIKLEKISLKEDLLEICENDEFKVEKSLI
jgi:hypothetical protein